MSDIIVTGAEVQSAISACRVTGWKGVAERLERGWRPERGASEAELLELFARHAAQARLEAEKVAHDVLGSLAWIQGQAEDAMGLAGDPKATEDDLRMLLSIASDIAINAEMASDKLRSLSTRGDQK